MFFFSFVFTQLIAPAFDRVCENVSRWSHKEFAALRDVQLFITPTSSLKSSSRCRERFSNFLFLITPEMVKHVFGPHEKGDLDNSGFIL
jgi:hypothetical protein